MEAATVRQLLEINRRFYTDFGENFSLTRQRIQPGVRKIIGRLVGTESMLDLGCGNGQLARTLAESGFSGTYLGLDFSEPLLKDAQTQPAGFSAEFLKADLTSLDWDNPILPARYSVITAFAVMHHIPGPEMRARFVSKVRRLLEPGGKFIHSNWQFLNSEKLKTRIQPWDAAGLSAADVDQGDALLDWRGGGSGLRYAHHFSAQELSALAEQTGFSVVETFLSDGQGGTLGLYQTWEQG